MELNKLFNDVEKKFYNLIKKDNNIDGQKLWQPIKNILSNYDIKAKKWKHQKKEYLFIMKLPEYYINGDEEKIIIEKNHFIIQTIRIPLKEEPSLRKIIQIALNIGQYTGLGKPKEKWMNLDNYLTKEDICNINSNLSKGMINDINKYLKSI